MLPSLELLVFLLPCHHGCKFIDGLLRGCRRCQGLLFPRCILHPIGHPKPLLANCSCVRLHGSLHFCRGTKKPWPCLYMQCSTGVIPIQGSSYLCRYPSRSGSRAQLLLSPAIPSLRFCFAGGPTFSVLGPTHSGTCCLRLLRLRRRPCQLTKLSNPHRCRPIRR